MKALETDFLLSRKHLKYDRNKIRRKGNGRRNFKQMHNDNNNVFLNLYRHFRKENFFLMPFSRGLPPPKPTI